MKVLDVMSKQIDYVKPGDKVERVALLIFGRGINGVPVCEGRKLVGLVTENDILKRFFPSIKDIVEDNFREGNFEAMEEKSETILSLPVEKIMNKKPKTVRPDTPLLRAQSLMNVNEIGRLPVVDENNNLIGIISKGDVFRTLVGEKLLFSENEDYNDFLSKTYYETVNWEDRLKHELPDLIKLFEANKVKTVLDVGCGTGEHSIELARRGYTVIGTDRSRSMIDEAKRQRVSLSSKTYGNVHFWNKDTEKVLAELNIQFDAILFLGNTISHNVPNYRRLIKSAASSLSNNGLMVFQITNFEKVIKTNKRLLNFNFAEPPAEDFKEYCFVEFYDKPDREKTILKTFAILASDGKRWKWTGIRNSLMAYTNEEKIKKILSNEGLVNIKSYGGSFDGRTWDYLIRKPFEPLRSDWLNVVAYNNKK